MTQPFPDNDNQTAQANNQTAQANNQTAQANNQTAQANNHTTQLENETHFGFKQVPKESKRHLVGEVFDSVASQYDVMNDLMSMGVHRLWKRFFIRFANIQPHMKVLDLAAGTADITHLIAKKLNHTGYVIASDINESMLTIGRDKMIDQGRVSSLGYAIANAEYLPFPDNSFDRITIAFGLRNVTDKDQALREMHRTLKPGGQALILEFSAVKQPLLKKLYDIYSFKVLPKIGNVVAKDGQSYQYLAESIRQHPNQETLQAMLLDAGFAKADFTNMQQGIVAIHRGFKSC